MTRRPFAVAATLVALAACSSDGGNATPATTAPASVANTAAASTTAAPTTTEQATTTTEAPLTVASLSGKLLIVSVSCDEQDRELNNNPIPQVCVMNADGTGARDYSDPTVAERSAAWSPDGTKIAIVSEYDGYDGRLVVMNADGSGRTDVTVGRTSFGSVRWSPDGQYLLMPSLWIGRADGTPYSAKENYHFVGTDPSPDNPDMSPDGTRIAYVSSRNGAPDELACPALFVVNTDGTDARQITPDPVDGDDPGPCAFDPPRWSPDGEHILFAYSTTDGMNLFTVRPDGSELTQLTTGEWGGATGAWSPDGSLIAYTANQNGRWAIYVMTADGSQSVRIPAPAGMAHGVYSIDWAAAA